MSNGNNSLFGFILLFIIIIIIFACVFGGFRWRRWERFDGTCTREMNYNDPNFENQRFFHYNNVGKLVSTDPVHVPRDVVKSALYSGEEISGHFESAKKKTQL